MDHKETGVFSSFKQILFSIQLEDVIAENKSYGFDLLDHALARFLNMTEGMGLLAHQGWDSGFPLLAELFEDTGRHRELRGACVNDGGLGGLNELIFTVGHALSLERPRFK